MLNPSVFNIGPTIAASILGSSYQQYRPTTATSPLAVPLATIPAWITADKGGRALTPSAYAKPIWYGMFDPTAVAVGDYLVGPLGTFFVASLYQPHPMQVINCNRTVNITQPVTALSTGANGGYGGDQVTTETVIATGWPCSMLQGTKGEVGSTKLPGDAKMPWYSVLLPAIPGVSIRNDMILTDDLGFRHLVSSFELTNLGWRLSAMLATT